MEIIDGKEYKLVEIRGRKKLVAKDGSLINPYKRKPRAKIHINRDEYPCCGGGIPVHLYVAHGWVEGYFVGAEVNHIDMNRRNYHADNLEWVTHQDNIKHSVRNSNHYSECKNGSKNGRSVFTAHEVKTIREMYRKGFSVFEIIRQTTDLSDYSQIRQVSSRYYAIIHNKTWKCIV